VRLFLREELTKLWQQKEDRSLVVEPKPKRKEELELLQLQIILLYRANNPPLGCKAYLADLPIKQIFLA
jgi:hypothetical protein